jgi:predicted site-specific integrase-resolvase
MSTAKATRVRPEQFARDNSVHINTVYSWIRDGVIPYIKIKRAILIDVEKAEAALSQFERNKLAVK